MIRSIATFLSPRIPPTTKRSESAENRLVCQVIDFIRCTMRFDMGRTRIAAVAAAIWLAANWAAAIGMALVT